MSTVREAIAYNILWGMERQAFYDWYQRDFADYIQGAEAHKTKEQI